jgi:hypothetical protein
MAPCIADGWVGHRNPYTPPTGKLNIAVLPVLVGAIQTESFPPNCSRGWLEKLPFHVTDWPAEIIMQRGAYCPGAAADGNVMTRDADSLRRSFAAKSSAVHPLTGITAGPLSATPPSE